MSPDVFSEVEREMLEKSLSNTAELNKAVIGVHFAANESAVVFGFHMAVLIPGASWKGCHGLHPEVIGVGSEGVDCLLEADFDFEAIAVESDNLEWVNGDIGSHEDHATAERVVDENESHEPSDGTPEEVHHVIAEQDIVFSVSGAGRSDEAFFLFP